MAFSVANELERMAALRDQGALTEDEFVAQKARLLGTPAAPTVDPSPVAAALNDRWVYFSMAVPLVVAALMAVDFKIGSFSPGDLYFIANLALLVLDYRQVRAAGHPIHIRLLMGGVVFFPLYLFARAVELRRGYKYAGLNLILLAILVLVVIVSSRHGSAHGTL